MEITRYNRVKPIDATLWLGEAYDDKPSVHFEWSSAGNMRGATFTFGGDEKDFTFFIGLPWLGSVYVSFDRILPASWHKAAREWAERKAEAINATEGRGTVYAYMLDPFDGRVTGVTLLGDHLSFKLWNSHSGWSQRDAKVAPWNGNGWYKGFFLRDAFLGKEKRTSHVVATRSLICQMPEGDYTVEVEISHVTRKRALTSTKHTYCATIKCDGGIPFPGKGENDYDCGEDAVFSWSSVEVPAYKIDTPTCAGDKFDACILDAVRDMRDSIMERRQRYGGSDWRPSANC